MCIFLATFAVVALCAACSAPAPQPVANAAAIDAVRASGARSLRDGDQLKQPRFASRHAYRRRGVSIRA